MNSKCKRLGTTSGIVPELDMSIAWVLNAVLLRNVRNRRRADGAGAGLYAGWLSKFTVGLTPRQGKVTNMILDTRKVSIVSDDIDCMMWRNRSEIDPASRLPART
jgi:hypothetical protein